MTLKGQDTRTLEADLVPWSDGVKSKGKPPLQTPWRTIQIADNPGDLITSYLILNLNELNQLTDTALDSAGQICGYLVGDAHRLSSWGLWAQNMVPRRRERKTVHLILLRLIVWLVCWLKGGMRARLVGWTEHGDQFSFTVPYPDFDLEAVAAYAAEPVVSGSSAIMKQGSPQRLIATMKRRWRMLLPCTNRWGSILSRRVMWDMVRISSG